MHYFPILTIVVCWPGGEVSPAKPTNLPFYTGHAGWRCARIPSQSYVLLYLSLWPRLYDSAPDCVPRYMT